MWTAVAAVRRLNRSLLSHWLDRPSDVAEVLHRELILSKGPHVVALGGGPIWGTTQRDIVKLFNEDPETEIIVLLGEIGGGTEIAAAEYIAESVRKPVVSLIVGRAAPEGKSLGHAGAIIRGNKGTAASKMEALEKAGASLATSPAQVVELIRKLG